MTSRRVRDLNAASALSGAELFYADNGTADVKVTADQLRSYAITYSQSVNVKDFGALGDNNADDTQAINDAIDSLSDDGGVIFFPPGTYLFTETILITKNNVTLIGAGRGSENGSFSGTTNLVYQGPTGADVRGIRFGDGSALLTGGGIQNMRINGALLTGHSVVQIDTAQWLAFDYVTIIGPAAGGYVLRLDSADIPAPNNCGNNHFHFCSFVGQAPGCSGVGIVIEDTPTGGNERSASRVSFYGCDIFWANDTATSYGLHLGHTDSNIFVLCDLQPNGGEIDGYTIYFDQSATLPVFPAGNNFFHCFPESSDYSRIFGGASGLGYNTFFSWDDQVTIPVMDGLVFYTNHGITYVDGIPFQLAATGAIFGPANSASAYDVVIQNDGGNAELHLASESAVDVRLIASADNATSFLAEIQANLTIQTNTTAKTISLNTNGGRIIANTPVVFPSYAKATLPTHATGATIYISDATGGAQLFFSDGSDWRRVTDRTTVT